MSFLQLPNELILDIAEYLEPLQLKNLYFFLRASKRLAYLLIPLLRRFAVNEKYMMNALCWSAAIRNEGMVRYLVDHGASDLVVTDIAGNGHAGDLDIPQRSGNDEELVKLVLEKGPNLVVSSFSTESPKHSRAAPALHQALRRNYNSLARILLEMGADVSAWSYGSTALHYAAFTRDETIIKKLLESGADTTAVNPEGMTPLHIAAVHGNESLLSLLLQHGADTMSIDAHGRTPISLLMDCFTLVPPKLQKSSPQDQEENEDSPERSQTKLRKVRLMLEQGNIAYKDRVGNTGLHRAAFFRDEALAKTLLKRGVKTAACGPNERTALHLAAMSGCSIIIREMVENYSADMMAQDRYGNTPLHLAIQYKRRRVVSLLTWMGADIDIADKCGRTAMHWAAGMGEADVVRLLLSKGANNTVRDNDGRTPLFLAAELGHVSIVKLLMDHGAEIDTRDKYGETVPQLVSDVVFNHPERCLVGSPSISLGNWPRREKYWGVWYNIPEKVAGRGSHKVLCNPGQHLFEINTPLVNMTLKEDDKVFWNTEDLFKGH